MPARIPMRDVVGRTAPQRIHEFGDKISAELKKQDDDKNAKRERSGKISGGKLGKPTLWVVLDLIGVKDDLDPYMLGKFKRGNDVEARAINFLTDIPLDQVLEIVEGRRDNPGWIPSSGVLKGEFNLQQESGYRGGVGFVDLAQKVGDSLVYHEIKSSTKMAYDKVSASGRYNGVVDVEKGIGIPYYHHAIQNAYYCLGDNVTRAFLHYFNADDYRLTSFAINPSDYKEEIDAGS